MKKHPYAPILISVLIFALVLGGVSLWLKDFSRENVRRQRDSLEAALSRNLVLCYSLEGRYPDTLEELLERFPVSYDASVFVIDYRLQGGNILPEIEILEIPR